MLNAFILLYAKAESFSGIGSEGKFQSWALANSKITAGTIQASLRAEASHLFFLNIRRALKGVGRPGRHHWSQQELGAPHNCSDTALTGTAGKDQTNKQKKTQTYQTMEGRRILSTLPSLSMLPLNVQVSNSVNCTLRTHLTTAQFWPAGATAQPLQAVLHFSLSNKNTENK